MLRFKLRKTAFLFLSIAFLACTKSAPTLEGLSMDQWKDDKNGCRFYRSTIADTLEVQRDKILALSEMEVVKLLGRPDRNGLYKRNQKFYSYYLSPAPQCLGDSSERKSDMLVIRFNAMGLAKEVAIESQF